MRALYAMQCITSAAAICLLLLGHSAHAAAPGSFEFRWDEGKCWLDAQDAKLTEILEKLATDSGLRVEYDEDDPSTVTVRIEGKDVEGLVRAITEGAVITYVVNPESEGYLVESVKVVPTADEATRRLASRSATRSPGAASSAAASKYSGVGATILYTRDRQGIHLRPTSANTPSAQAGIKPEDLVVAINGKPIPSFRSTGEMAAAIRGPEGSAVNFTVKSPNGSTAVKRVVRRSLNVRPTQPRR